MNIDMQKFARDGDTETSSGAWYQAEDQTNRWIYVPAGTIITTYNGMIEDADDETVPYAIDGATSVTGDSQTVTITAIDISAVTVYDSGTTTARYTINLGGGDKTTLSVIVGTKRYAVDSNGKLTVPLPDFGLMTQADKLKLDGINSSTYLTTAAASSTYLTQASAGSTYLTQAAAATTYATKAEMHEYVRQLVESDTGYVALNGNGSEVGVIPAFSKKAPQLSASNTDMGINFSVDVEISRLGNGAISVTDVTAGDSSYTPTVTVNGTTITVYRWSSSDDYATMTVSVAETDEYKAASITVTVTQRHSSATPDLPTPE